MSKNIKEQQWTLQMLSDDPQDAIQDRMDLIYDYAEGKIEGEDVAALFPEVHAYLKDFGDEDEHYQAVLSLLEAEKYGRLAVLPEEYRFDAKRVLPPGISVPKPFVVTKLPNGNFVAQIAQAFLDVQSSLSTQPTFVRSQKNELFKLESTVSDNDNDNTKVTVEACRTDEHDSSCSLIVQFVKDGAGWPKAGGVTVKLTDTEAQQKIDEQVTDPFGKVKFDRVTLAKLGEIAIEIES